jgi:hypothetical protein
MRICDPDNEYSGHAAFRLALRHRPSCLLGRFFDDAFDRGLRDCVYLLGSAPADLRSCVDRTGLRPALLSPVLLFRPEAAGVRVNLQGRAPGSRAARL